MKNNLSCLFILIVIIIFTFCYRGNSVRRSGRSDLYAVANYSVPFVTGNPEWDELPVNEVDSYGRVLFTYKSFNQSLSEFNGNYVFALVICQKSDNDFTYFYENYSFILSRGSYEFADSEISLLKEWNDWDKEIINSKLTKISNSFGPYDELATYDSVILNNAIASYLSNSQLSVDIDLISIDSDLNIFSWQENS